MIWTWTQRSVLTMLDPSELLGYEVVVFHTTMESVSLIYYSKIIYDLSPKIVTLISRFYEHFDGSIIFNNSMSQYRLKWAKLHSFQNPAPGPYSEIFTQLGSIRQATARQTKDYLTKNSDSSTKWDETDMGWGANAAKERIKWRDIVSSFRPYIDEGERQIDVSNYNILVTVCKAWGASSDCSYMIAPRGVDLIYCS